MIVIEPIGGIGNQLFVYGTGLANARRLSVSLVADLGRISADPVRGYELASFKNSLVEEHFEPAPSKKSMGYRLHKRYPSFSERGRYKNLVYETDKRFDPRLLRVQDGSRLRGYFQSWRYVDGVAEILRNQVRSVSTPSANFLSQRSHLRGLQDWVGVHVRLGDYRNLPHMGLPEEYFRAALARLDAWGRDQRIVVFSDSPPEAKKMPIWARFENVLFLERSGLSPLETLLLMSEAPRLVMANSTFSWWAGFISDEPVRPVVFPAPWSSRGSPNEDLTPPHWIGVRSN